MSRVQAPTALPASGWIGRDLARQFARADGRARWVPVLLVSLLLAALALAALRVEIIRQRYRLASAVRVESELLEEQRALTAEQRRLRDPARLARAAADLGLARPERILELTPPGEPRP